MAYHKKREIIRYVKISLLVVLMAFITLVIIMYNTNRRKFAFSSKSYGTGVHAEVRKVNEATNLKIFGTDVNHHDFSIVAESAAESPDAVKMINIKAQVYLTDKGPSLISANTGVVSIKEMHAVLEGAVEIIIEGQHKMRTERIDVLYNEGQATGNQGIEIISPLGNISASGFEAVNASHGGKIVLMGPVKAHMNYGAIDAKK